MAPFSQLKPSLFIMRTCYNTLSNYLSSFSTFHYSLYSLCSTQVGELRGNWCMIVWVCAFSSVHHLVSTFCQFFKIELIGYVVMETIGVTVNLIYLFSCRRGGTSLAVLMLWDPSVGHGWTLLPNGVNQTLWMKSWNLNRKKDPGLWKRSHLSA